MLTIYVSGMPYEELKMVYPTFPLEFESGAPPVSQVRKAESTFIQAQFEDVSIYTNSIFVLDSIIVYMLTYPSVEVSLMEVVNTGGAVNKEPFTDVQRLYKHVGQGFDLLREQGICHSQ